MELLNDTLSPQQQGWKRVVTCNLNGHKVRVTIYRDSYIFQSRIYSEVWSPATLSWNQVERRAGEDYAELPNAYSLNGPRNTDQARVQLTLATDELFEDMIRYAEEILA
jgi:hypothetical protein